MSKKLNVICSLGIFFVLALGMRFLNAIFVVVFMIIYIVVCSICQSSKEDPCIEKTTIGSVIVVSERICRDGKR